MKQYRKYMFLSATLIWMGLIFFFSAQPAEQSGSVSGFFWQLLTDIFIKILGQDAGTAFCSVILSEHFIRKSGHFFEYLVLGILCYETVDSFALAGKIPYSILFSILYASTDEIHQIFTPGRGPAIADVSLDSFAALIGIIAVALLQRRKKRKQALKH